MNTNKDLITELNTTVRALVNTTKELTSRISGDIRDLYEKVNKLREEFARLDANNINDHNTLARLEKTITEVQKSLGKLIEEAIKEQDLIDLLDSVDSIEDFVAIEKGRREANEDRNTKEFRKKLLQLLGIGIAGGAVGGGATEFIQYLMDII